MQKTKHLRIWLWAGLICLTATAPASATREDNRKIPVNQFGCALCHDTSGASFNEMAGNPATLTTFGDQWLALGASRSDRTWADMASQNADADGCSNGYELGDARGLYVPRTDDPTESVDSRDPNNSSDCSLPINEKSWGTLKQLFGDE